MNYEERMWGFMLGLLLVASILGFILGVILWTIKRYNINVDPPKKKPDFFCEIEESDKMEKCDKQCMWCRMD